VGESDVSAYRKVGWCWDCNMDVQQKVIIPTCNKNKRGLAGVKHGNDGTCSDEFCDRTHYANYVDYEWSGKTPLSKYEAPHYRCATCDTLNVEGNGHGRPKKKKGKG
jgi:hypothetical protein